MADSESQKVRFEVVGESIIDHETGLEWQAVAGEPTTWVGAAKYAQDLCESGRDWRLPTVKELMTLVDYSVPGTRSTFPGMPNVQFWSVTSSPQYDGVMVVDFSQGEVRLALTSQFASVRCVRTRFDPGAGTEEPSNISKAASIILSSVLEMEPEDPLGPRVVVGHLVALLLALLEKCPACGAPRFSGGSCVLCQLGQIAMKGSPLLKLPDSDETRRWELMQEINARGADRYDLERDYGQVWDPPQVMADFEILDFLAPYCRVIRRSDGVKGFLTFQHFPRFYWGFQTVKKG